MNQSTPLVAAFLLTLCGIVRSTSLSGAPNPSDISEESRAWFTASAQAGSTFRPLKNAAEDRWDSVNPRDGSNLEMLLTRTSAGFSKGGWSIESVSRLDAIGQAQKDTLDAYSSQLFGIPGTAGRPYTVDYALSGFEARGLALGRAFQSESDGHIFRFGVNVTLLDAKRYKSQQAVGLATVQGNGSLLVTGSTYNDDTAINTSSSGFIDRFQNQTPSGSGYAVDLGLHYTNPHGVELEWTIADAFSEILWEKVPEITLSGSSSFNGQFPGGHKVLLDLNQTLPPKHTITVRVPFQRYSLQATENTIGPIAMFNAGISREISDHWNIACDYDFYFKSVGFLLSHKWFEFAFRTDKLNLDVARAISIHFALRATFD